MGVLAKTLDEVGKRPTAYSVKQNAARGGYDLYGEVIDRIDGVILKAQLAEVEEWLDSIDHTLPAGWREAFEDRLILKREELEAEDIGNIMRDRFDF